MSIPKKLAVFAAALALPVLAAGAASAQDAVPADGDDGAKAQLQDQEQHQYRHQHRVRTNAGDGQGLRVRAAFADRNGDGVCDQLQHRQLGKKLQKGKTHRNRNREGAARGFGRGGHGTPAAAD